MYYFKDNSTFKSKLLAIEYSRKTNTKPYLYYYDEIYNNVNWTKEPELSLQELYKLQAQKIRDEYDYVILAYSGGYDSTNILETFYYNNIKLDKIIIVGAFSQDINSRSDANHNGELYYNAFPLINRLSLQDITIKLDYTEYFNDLNNFSVVKYSDDWVHEIGSFFSVHNWFWRDIDKYVVPREYRDKRAVIVFGKDKPKLFKQNSQIGFRFSDMPANNYGGFNLLSDVSRVNFYWDPTFAEIIIKQLHVLKNSGVNAPDKIVYRLRHPPIYKSPKSSSPFLSLRDQYLAKYINTDIFKLYKSGIDKLKDFSYTTNIPIYSKFYPIGYE